MNQTSSFDWLSGIADHYYIQTLISLFILLAYAISKKVIPAIVQRATQQSKITLSVSDNANRVINFVLIVVCLLCLSVVWGIDVKGVLVLSSSLLAITGVAFFASWSPLSNVTAFFILIMQPAIRTGNFVRVIDGDNYIEGNIVEVNLFSTRIELANNGHAMFPNILLLSRVIIDTVPNAFSSPLGKLSDQLPKKPTDPSPSANQKQ